MSTNLEHAFPTTDLWPMGVVGLSLPGCGQMAAQGATLVLGAGPAAQHLDTTASAAAPAAVASAAAAAAAAATAAGGRQQQQ